MKNLAELTGDTFLTIKTEWDFYVMTKAEFEQELNHGEFEDPELLEVTIADKQFAQEFSLSSALDDYEDGMHEDWKQAVLDGIDKTQEIEDVINTAIKNNPSYYEGEKVLINFN
ncbi:hypothetical protein [Acetobacterium sp.]|uniref:hypothetical protein n=1 Tax=Acetobacterium sp. TaxID=1872094 RepID=UPI002F4153C8